MAPRLRRGLMAASLHLREEPYRQFIGGEWRQGGENRTRDVIDPATNKPFASFYEAGIQDVDDAVEAAKRAFEGGEWRSNGSLRAKLLFKLAELIRGEGERLSALDTLETGHPIRETRQAVN